MEAAARCELFAWRATPEGRLAEVLVLDQFSRNLYRDTARAFAQDALALAQRSFAYMPYMHSESALVHAQAALLFVLGRTSTPEEQAFLSEPGSSF